MTLEVYLLFREGTQYVRRILIADRATARNVHEGECSAIGVENKNLPAPHLRLRQQLRRMSPHPSPTQLQLYSASQTQSSASPPICAYLLLRGSSFAGNKVSTPGRRSGGQPMRLVLR